MEVFAAELALQGPSLVRVLADVVLGIIQNNERAFGPVAASKAGATSPFQSSAVPVISVEEYMARISKYSKCHDACLVLALVLLDRLIHVSQTVLTSLNVHRLLITAILLAAKLHEDDLYNNSVFAKLGGVSTAEMNGLELEFIKLLGFDLLVRPETFSKYYGLLLIQHQNLLAPVPPPVPRSLPLSLFQSRLTHTHFPLDSPPPCQLHYQPPLYTSFPSQLQLLLQPHGSSLQAQLHLYQSHGFALQQQQQQQQPSQPQPQSQLGAPFPQCHAQIQHCQPGGANAQLPTESASQGCSMLAAPGPALEARPSLWMQQPSHLHPHLNLHLHPQQLQPLQQQKLFLQTTAFPFAELARPSYELSAHHRAPSVFWS